MRFKSSHVVVAFALLGAALIAVDHAMPFVRNDLVYARAAEHVIAHGFDPRPVVADSRLSYDKPIGFAWIGAPLVAAFGAHVGLRIASLAGAVLFLVACAGFLRELGVRETTRLDERGRTLALALVAFTAIVAYQTWSAHPDGLFAAAVVWTWTFALRWIREPERMPVARAALLAVVLCASLVLKNYALILAANVAALVVTSSRALFANRRRPWSFLLAVSLALLAFAAFAWAGYAGKNPLVRIAGEGGGAGQYGHGELVVGALGTLLQVAICVATSLGVALVLVRPRDLLARSTLVIVVALALPYVGGLMAFPTSYYNMRYFLPLLPIAAFLCARGAATRAWSKPVLLAHAAFALAMIAVFDVPAVHALAAPAIPQWTWEKGYGRQGLLDNLRMAQHRARADELDRANAAVEPDGVLYLVDCAYYGDAMHGVYERDGLLRADVRTKYARSRDLAPEEERFVAWLFRGDARTLERFGSVTELGPGLFRVERARDGARGAPR